jgi:hypothetical protein
MTALALPCTRRLGIRLPRRLLAFLLERVNWALIVLLLPKYRQARIVLQSRLGAQSCDVEIFSKILTSRLQRGRALGAYGS